MRHRPPSMFEDRQADGCECGLEAELAVRGLAAALFAGGQALLLEDLVRVSDLRLVDKATSDAGTEFPVPVILDNHEATATRTLLGRGGNDDGGPPRRVGSPGSPPVGPSSCCR